MSLDDQTDQQSANETMQALVNSFDGSHNSNVCSAGNYKFYISPASGFTLRYLNVISNLEINSKVNVNEYVEATNEFFAGELNQGAKAILRGTIDEINKRDTHWELKVSNESGSYNVYYNYDNFIDCSALSNTCSFYGQIAASKAGYAGCIRLDYDEDI